MSAAAARTEQEQSSSIITYNTDLSTRIELATCRAIKDTRTSPWDLTYGDLFYKLSMPDPHLRAKDGPLFLPGPCPLKRSAHNLARMYVAVLDADCSLDENHKPVIGAPDPIEVHQHLVKRNISHALYTTHSHGGPKGCRYRVVFPVVLLSRTELKAFMEYIVAGIQEDGIPLALSLESSTWGQGWLLPRIKDQSAPFLSLQHVGVTLDPRNLATMLGYCNEQGEELFRSSPVSNTISGDPFSFMGLMDRYFPVTEQLQAHGYTFISESYMTDEEGHEALAQRWRRPDSTTGAGGVVVMQSRGRLRAFSHHDNDPLNNGHANDSMECFKVLNGVEDNEQAMVLAVPVLQNAIVEEMNGTYPSIMMNGSKFRFGNKYINDLGGVTVELMTKEDFDSAMLNEPGVPIMEVSETDGADQIRMMARGAFWRGSRERVLYNGVTYSPMPITEPHQKVVERDGRPYLNIFPGWPLKPKPGAWPLLEWHLRHAVCGSNEEEYQYLLDWFSHLVQHPAEKAGVALVLKGGKGWGKSTPFAKLLRRILGSGMMVLGNNSQLTGKFNEHLRDKLVGVVEESFWAGNKADEGVLKHLISDTETAYEPKGYSVMAGASYIRVIMITNNEWAAPASGDERRFFIPSMAPASVAIDQVEGRKGAFFPRLYAEIEAGGAAAFLHHVAYRQIASGVVNVPETPGLTEQKARSLHGVRAWLYEALHEGAFRSERAGEARLGPVDTAITFSAVFESAVRYAGRGAADRGIKVQAQLALTEAFGELPQTADGLVFPPLDRCRTMLDKYLGFTIRWPGQDRPSVEVTRANQETR